MKTFWLSIIGLAVSVATSTAATNTPPRAVRTATPAPMFEMAALAGEPVRLADLRQPAVIVTFWLETDKPSRRQMTVLAAVQAELGTNAVAIVAPLLQPTVTPAVREAVEQLSLPFPVTRYNLETLEGFGELNAIPTTFVIDHNRNVIQRYVGLVHTNALRLDVEAILRAHETAPSE